MKIKINAIWHIYGISEFDQGLILGLTWNSTCLKVIDNDAAPLPPGFRRCMLSQLHNKEPQHNKQEIHLHII